MTVVKLAKNLHRPLLPCAVSFPCLSLLLSLLGVSKKNVGEREGVLITPQRSAAKMKTTANTSQREDETRPIRMYLCCSCLRTPCGRNKKVYPAYGPKAGSLMLRRTKAGQHQQLHFSGNQQLRSEPPTRSTNMGVVECPASLRIMTRARVLLSKPDATPFVRSHLCVACRLSNVVSHRARRRRQLVSYDGQPRNA